MRAPIAAIRFRTESDDVTQHERALAALVLSWLWACDEGSSDPRDPAAVDGDTSMADGGTPDAGEASAAVRFSAPGADVEFVNGRVTLQVTVDSAAADRVALAVDGVLLANLPQPFQYDWDSTAHPEGARALTATAFEGETPLGSAMRSFVVDRTPPALSTSAPLEAGDVDLARGITLRFSEPLVVADEAAFRVTLGGEAVASSLSLSGDATFAQVTLHSPTLVTPADLTLAWTEGVADRAGNVAAPQTLAFHAPSLLPVALPEGLVAPFALSAGGARLMLSGIVSEPGEMARAYAYTHIDDGTWERSLVLQAPEFAATDVALSPDGTKHAVLVTESRCASVNDCEQVSSVYVPNEVGGWSALSEPLGPGRMAEIRIDDAGIVTAGYGSGLYQAYRNGGWISPPFMAEGGVLDFQVSGADFYVARMVEPTGCELLGLVEGEERGPVPLFPSYCTKVSLAALYDGRVVVDARAAGPFDFVRIYDLRGDEPTSIPWPGLATMSVEVPDEVPALLSDGRHFFFWTADGLTDDAGQLISTEAFGSDHALWLGRPVMVRDGALFVVNIVP